ncbi:ABC transporter ATP-binding protein [Eilatimonas milleporae]|uniref:Phospholipid/cholesterol/gamma-HCH transport system ATP-binding protein n=1 Tax=Eilatimonas milleporae TaxID=911205 RepID=A0A3M0C6L4_9PROT|nr:ABC transporter ATP-binding protein [Eilatimonas milleporae]RMB02719.1 phospholipid/cholesterol/gamma-HCH transport system ATP-binding protein [Eilatimonas milleporae]
MDGNAITDSVIRVRGLMTAFGTQVVHDGLDLDVRRGEILGVVGGSGTGKSVLLKAITGLVHPVAGTIEIDGVDQSDADSGAAMRSKRDWGVLFQDGALFTSLTVGQNIQVPMREHFHLSQNLMDDLALSKIAMVGLPLDAASKFPSDLSGGMRKRAALARSLALDPHILFLDEPTAGLDPIGAHAFDQLIAELKDSLDLTVFLVTHDLDTLVGVCDRIAVLGNKRILINAPLEDVARFDHPWVQDYFNGPRGRAAGSARA